MKSDANEKRPAAVPERAKQGGETASTEWAWVERSIWTERMLEALHRGVKGGVWFSLAGRSHTSRSMGSTALRQPIAPCFSPGKPPTGEPDAGEPHVRFGGRGGASQCAIPTPIVARGASAPGTGRMPRAAL